MSSTGKTCRKTGCSSDIIARGLCNKHYLRARNSGELQTRPYDRHGGRYTKTYATWSAMRNRCEKPSDTMYYRYGGRGIQVCDRWQSFRNFRQDMGERPEGMTLERIDSEEGYSPGNCRWATRKEQNRNTSATAWLTIYGKTMSRAEWHDIVCHEVSYSAIKQRQRRGWTDKEAVFGRAS